MALREDPGLITSRINAIQNSDGTCTVKLYNKSGSEEEFRISPNLTRGWFQAELSGDYELAATATGGSEYRWEIWTQLLEAAYAQCEQTIDQSGWEIIKGGYTDESWKTLTNFDAKCIELTGNESSESILSLLQPNKPSQYIPNGKNVMGVVLSTKNVISEGLLSQYQDRLADTHVYVVDEVDPPGTIDRKVRLKNPHGPDKDLTIPYDILDEIVDGVYYLFDRP